ncbi:MAG: protease inhibitor I42 family protein [Spirochaetes bacterium]|nr:protease inhibitor I42 family protein [Spirochaetota bacterium]
MHRIASVTVISLVLFTACAGGNHDGSRSSTMLELEEQVLVTLRVGQKAACSVGVHGSVGKTAEAETADPDIVRLVDSTIAYLHPENMKPGMTGGDAATRTFVFEALAPGETTITVRMLYRGRLEETKIWKVRVEK